MFILGPLQKFSFCRAPSGSTPKMYCDGVTLSQMLTFQENIPWAVI